MDENALISQTIQKRLGGEYNIETRTDFRQYDIDNKADAGLMLVVKNPLIESNPEQAKQDILKALGEVDALKPYIVAETNTNHMERLAKELEYFRAQEFAINDNGDGKPAVTIHEKIPEWFRELPKRSGWNLKHALDVTKTDTGIINISINIPKDVIAEDIVKNIEIRKEAIMETLASRVEKYTPAAKTPEEKAALREQVKRLDFSVTAQGDSDRKTLAITIMSPDQLAATKQPGGITPDKVRELNPTNPLLALQNGEDDQVPGKPQPHLQKALARAILYSGPPEKAAEILPYILGKEDMRRNVGKSLTRLKEKTKDPELGKRIDAFLADPAFKDLNQWGKEVEKQEFIPEAPKFFKSTGDYSDPTKPYEPGVMRVDIKLPADKFPEIRARLAGAEAAAPGMPTPDVLAQAIDSKLKPLVEAMIGTVSNQRDLALVVQELQNRAPAPSMPQATPLEQAANALVAVAHKLDSWVERMEARSQATPAASAADEAMANTVLAAAGVAAGPNQSLAGAIAAAGPTSLLARGEKPAEQGPVTPGM